MADECEVCAARKSRQRAGEPLCRFCEFGTCFEENEELVCRSCDKVNGHLWPAAARED